MASKRISLPLYVEYVRQAIERGDVAEADRLIHGYSIGNEWAWPKEEEMDRLQWWAAYRAVVLLMGCVAAGCGMSLVLHGMGVLHG